jgi:hypothetical protein
MWLLLFRSLENDGIIQCQYPGHEIFTGTHALLRLKAEYKFFIKNDRQVVLLVFDLIAISKNAFNGKNAILSTVWLLMNLA